LASWRHHPRAPELYKLPDCRNSLQAVCRKSPVKCAIHRSSGISTQKGTGDSQIAPLTQNQSLVPITALIAGKATTAASTTPVATRDEE
jgi:hypothetical protein